LHPTARRVLTAWTGQRPLGVAGRPYSEQPRNFAQYLKEEGGFFATLLTITGHIPTISPDFL
jgi:hypothetical protein